MTDINHSERAHSIFSPSGFSRWSACPASAMRTKDIESEDTEASLRGTWLHEQAEELIRDPFYVMPDSKYNTEDNYEQLTKAVSYVEELIESVSFFSEPILMLEERVDFGWYGHEDVFGTSDIILFDRDAKVLTVADYKFGGFAVSPENNGQLYLYGMASAKVMIDRLMDEHIERGEVLEETPIEFVDMVIIQPALDTMVSIHRLALDDLVEWFDKEGRPAIEAAKKENPDVMPGDTQCRWCPLSGDCPEQTADAKGLFDMYENLDDENLENNDLSVILAELPKIEQWCKAVKAKALAKLNRGEKIIGYKLVEGRANRKWADQEKVDRWLGARGIAKADRTVTSLIGIPQAEKLLKDVIKGNPRLQKNFEALINRPEGKPTLAKADSPKREIEVIDPLLNGDI